MFAKKYHLLDYVVTQWDYHTKWLEEENTATWRSFRDLALNKSLPFQFRKWGLNEHHGSYGCNSCESGSSDDSSQDLPFTTLIHYAAQIGHLPLLRLFSDDDRLRLEGYLVHEECRPLLIACFNDQVDVVKHLLHNYTAYVDGNTFREALHGAAHRGHENTLCALLPYASALGADLSAALPNAIHQGKVSCAERLITAGARFDLSRSGHWEALYAAIEGEFDSTVAMLIQRGFLNVEYVHDLADDIELDLNIVPKGLVLAAMRGLTLTLNAMINCGVPIDHVDESGKMALHDAAERGHGGAIRLLLEHGSSVNAYTLSDYRNIDRLTALHLAAMRGHTDVVQILCEHGARVNEASERYAFTPLHLAAEHGHADTIRKLLEYGSSPNQSDCQGWTPLDVAIEASKKDAEACLREWEPSRGVAGGYSEEKILLRTE